MMRKYIQRRREAKRARLQQEIAFIDQYRDPLPCHAKPMADRRERFQIELDAISIPH